jgi:asparagine synthase (glutamine-hydrolysing)
MCGITGILNTAGNSIQLVDLFSATNSIRHRGPDDEGYFFHDSRSGLNIDFHNHGEAAAWQQNNDPSNGFNLGFGFRRLSILDLSPTGHQPMSSSNGDVWIVFNGEIYNYIELRNELIAKGYSFHTQTDTEVIINSYLEWGTDCLIRFNGMWAFALWDTRKQQLFCGRDRLGIKPFYYSWTNGCFTFGSEIKALLFYPGNQPKQNDAVIYDYLSSGLVNHSENTFYEGIQQLIPGHFLLLCNRQLTVRRYWELSANSPSEHLTDEEYASRFYALFEDALRLHLRSDVPIGTCLSGGIDSSSIVCIANKLLFSDRVIATELVGKQQKTFSSCFDDPRFDERKYIQTVLDVTNAEENFVFPSAQKLIGEIEKLIWHQDEPFGSTSMFAQWCVMEKAARRGVKVLLDGQGADELLAGYQPFYSFYWSSLLQSRKFKSLAQELSAYRNLFGGSIWWNAARILKPYLPRNFINFTLRLTKKQNSGEAQGIHPDFSHRYKRQNPTFPRFTQDNFKNYLYENLVYSSLPGLLRYEDRNSMAHSIEARVPFLDYRLVEWIFSLPNEQKIHGGLTKYVMRSAMKNILPEQIRMRTDKMGFVTPERTWFSNDMRSWALDILTSPSFQQREYFNAPVIQKMFDDQIEGKRDLTFIAWRWINLELWLRSISK